MKYSSTLLVIVQVAIALNIYRVFDYFENPFLRLGVFLLITYFIGATIKHALFLAIHEITHYMAFKKKWPNNILTFVANIPIVFPHAMSFKYYQALHHWEHGKDGADADIPLKGEDKLFKVYLGEFIWYATEIFSMLSGPRLLKKYSLKSGWFTILFFNLMLW
jgi:sphingolipid delta-4 desaturase